MIPLLCMNAAECFHAAHDFRRTVTISAYPYSLQNTRRIHRFWVAPINFFHSQFPFDPMKRILPSLIHHLSTIMHALHLPILLLQRPLHLEIQLPLLLQPLLLHISHDALVHCLRCVRSLFCLSLSDTKIELGILGKNWQSGGRRTAFSACCA